MKSFNYNAAFRGAWRRVFARSPVVRAVMDEGRRTVPRYKQDGTRHKVDRVEFQCQVCDSWEIRDRMSVDHIIPVIDENKGFEDWNTFYNRLVCEKSNLQRICDPCHDKKTAEERRKRTIIKDTATLDELLKQVMNPAVDVKALKKELSKYTKKSKPDEIKTRALSLKDILLRNVK